MAEPTPPDDSDEIQPPAFIERSALLRQLFFERRLRVTLVLLALFGIGLCALLLKWYPSTPAGVTPRIRISAVDLLQAWSLERAARGLEAEGKTREAIETWAAAAANHPGRIDLHRRILDLLADENPPQRASLTNGLSRGAWLANLTGTNAADQARSARLLRHHGLNDIALRLLEPLEASMDPGTTGLYLELLFDQGQFRRFGELWKRLPAGTRDNPELALHHAAWQAEWGPPGEQREGESALAAARTDPRHRILAHRLSLPVAEARGDLDALQISLEALVDAREDRVADHVRLWSALVRAGRADEAGARARAFARPPVSAAECRALALVLVRLGETAEADLLLERGIRDFDDPELWLLRSQLLREAGRWDDLVVLGTTLRSGSRWRNSIGGFGWFLEGFGELRQGAAERARTAFANAVSNPIDVPYLALLTAGELTRLGQGAAAETLLKQLRDGFADFAPFWHEMAIAAYRTDRITEMRDAAAEAYRLEPSNPVYANNLAAAHLILREQPTEALALTMAAESIRPNHTGTRINHALALVQAGRTEDATTVLDSLPTRMLSGAEVTTAALARFEIALRNGRPDEALRHHADIQPAFLSGPEKRWLESEHARALGSVPPPATNP